MDIDVDAIPKYALGTVIGLIVLLVVLVAVAIVYSGGPDNDIKYPEDDD